MEKFSNKLDMAKMLYEEMTLIISICKVNSGGYRNNNRNNWCVFWDDFWALSNEFPFAVDWCDYDTGYEEDIMQRYNAIESFMEGLQYKEQHNEQKNKF